MQFHVLNGYDPVPKIPEGSIKLSIDRWDDFSFETQFYLSIYNEKGERLFPIGDVKIGYLKQAENTDTRKFMEKSFSKLNDNFFSLGQSAEYYSELRDKLNDEQFEEIMIALRDVVYNPTILKSAEKENVFTTSLLRSVSINAVKGQFTRIIHGQALLTPYNFSFSRSDSDTFSKLELDFKVSPSSAPRTNIHSIIGRNGAGKTTLLNSMIKSITCDDKSLGSFYCGDSFPPKPIESDYFSNVVSVSFSAFDPFNPPREQSDPLKGTCYYYVGLKESVGDVGFSSLKTLDNLRSELITSLGLCFSTKVKRRRWIDAIKTLESDNNFSEMRLRKLPIFSEKDKGNNTFRENALKVISKMSSGHAIILLTITKLIEKVEEKTLVLLDEPEGHLHPPLLSAFIRALSNLLFNRNGVAIIATHSPVVLQEVPKRCVWKINRSGLTTEPYRPSIETFGENVSILTREIFGLEVVKSGFHDLLVKSVSTGRTYEEIVADYDEQLGVEARALLKALVVNRDRSKAHAKA